MVVLSLNIRRCTMISMLAMLISMPAFCYADSDQNRANLSITIAPSVNIVGFADPMVISDKNQTISTETVASFANNEQGLNVALSSSQPNRCPTPLVPLNDGGDYQVCAKLVCTPCGESSEPLQFAGKNNNKQTVTLNGKQTSSKTCNDRPATCHFELEPDALQNKGDKPLVGSAILTFSPAELQTS